MVQQINLIDVRLMPRTLPFGSQHALYAALGVLVLGMIGSIALQVIGRQVGAETQQLQQQVVMLQTAANALSAAAPAASAAAATPELDRLKVLEASQRRVQAALEGGVAGDREGPGDYFKAFARQAHAQVWITGFAISDSGSALEIDGRMAQADQLTDYLRRLRQEPRFKGRSFDQLALNGVERSTGAPLPYTEFTLRTRPMGGPGGGQTAGRRR